MKLYMFRTVRLSIIKSLFTVPSAVLCVIQVCRQPSSRTRMESSSILVLLETPDDGQRNFPKHVEFHAKVKFVKLVHLVGFIMMKLIRLST
jgi:hypothetical protein